MAGTTPVDDIFSIFNIKVTPRAGKTPTGGKLYYKLTSAYTGTDDVSFNGTVKPTGDDTFAAYPKGMPYVAGTHGDGLGATYAVAELTSSGATLTVEILGFKASRSSLIAFMQAISVEYAWVDEAS